MNRQGIGWVDKVWDPIGQPDTAEKPLHWRKPWRVAVRGDLFREDIPDDFLYKVFGVIVGILHLQFFVSTARPARMRDFIADYFSWQSPEGDKGITPPDNLWLGVVVKDQEEADRYVPILLDTPAAARFVWVLPRGPVDLTRIDLGVKQTRGYGPQRIYWDAFTGWEHHCKPDCTLSAGEFGRVSISGQCKRIDWIICGGETGPESRPVYPGWVRKLRDQAQSARVPFFFQGWGDWMPAPYMDQKTRRFEVACIAPDGSPGDSCGNGVRFIKVGSKRAGRLLDGKLWNMIPETLFGR